MNIQKEKKEKEKHGDTSQRESGPNAGRLRSQQNILRIREYKVELAGIKARETIENAVCEK